MKIKEGLASSQRLSCRIDKLYDLTAEAAEDAEAPSFILPARRGGGKRWGLCL
jgi:hypothetical protein